MTKLTTEIKILLDSVPMRALTVSTSHNGSAPSKIIYWIEYDTPQEIIDKMIDEIKSSAEYMQNAFLKDLYERFRVKDNEETTP